MPEIDEYYETARVAFETAIVTFEGERWEGQLQTQRYILVVDLVTSIAIHLLVWVGKTAAIKDPAVYCLAYR